MSDKYDGLIKPIDAEAITIDDLFDLKLITAREYNALHRREIFNALQIISYSKDELRGKIIISDAGFNKIISAVHSLGLTFKDEVEKLSEYSELIVDGLSATVSLPEKPSKRI